MKIDAEKSRYGGDTGWPSDPALFADVAVNWKQWLGHAGEHLYATQLLLTHVEQHDLMVERLLKEKPGETIRVPPSLTSIYFLHCAFSVENAFKGVIAATRISELRAEISKTHRVPSILLGHDLVDLAARTGLRVATDDDYMLTFLSRYGTWAGRYPIPVRNADNAGTNRLSDGKHYLTAGYNPKNLPAFVAFSGTTYAWARSTVEAMQPKEAAAASQTT